MTTRIYNKKCYICSIDFITRSQKQKNCIDHLGMHHKTNRINDGVHEKKCSKCRSWKDVNSFYPKSGGTEKMKSSFCKKCMNNSSLKAKNHKGIVLKLEAVKNKGGACIVCGYKKNLGALVFHHVDPSIKERSLDVRSISNMKKEDFENEISKCSLLCHNCHYEEHYPHLNMSNFALT